MEYVGCKVAKAFPGFGKKKFKGEVIGWDGDGEFEFRIKYEDSDEEDVSRKELMQILVDQPKAVAGKRKREEAEAPATGKGKGKGKGRGSPTAPPGTAAPAADGRGRRGAAASEEEEEAAAASAEEAGPSGGRGAGRSGGAGREQQPGSSDLTQEAIEGEEGLQALIGEVAAKAKARALKLTRYLPEEGEGAAGRPLHAHAVTCGDLCFISTIYAPDIKKCLGDPADVAELEREYKSQAQQVLALLDQQLKAVGSSKDQLINVNVLLREVDTGTPFFAEVWNSWVNKATLPAMFMHEAFLDNDALVGVAAQVAVPKSLF